MDLNRDPLVPEPVFILSAMRSGSTLLRCILGSHSCVHAPAEMHFDGLSLRALRKGTRTALRARGLSLRDTEHLLWDRLLYQELAGSGKRVLVEKTPHHVLNWRRLDECWPNARYVFLLRNPEYIYASMRALGGSPAVRRPRFLGGHPWATRRGVLASMLPMLTELHRAREALSGYTIRYEDLTANPEETVRKLCDHLGLVWEPGMLEYGRFQHGPFVEFLGDQSERIKSGRVLQGRARPPGTRLPATPRMTRVSRELGYPVGGGGWPP